MKHPSTNPAKPDKSPYAGIVDAKSVYNSATVTHTLFSVVATAVAVIIATALMQCTSMSAPLAGGASSTEVSKCAIMGTVVDSLGNSISGGKVMLRSFNYIPLSSAGDSTWTIRDTVTDKDGGYRFDKIMVGRYCIECVFIDSFGQTMDCSIDSGETLKVMQPAMVKPMAVIRGSNMLSEPVGSRKPVIQTRGMEHSAPIDSSGHFTLKIPAGWTRLALQGIDSIDTILDTLVYLKPGENIEFGPPPQKSGKLCDSLGCDMAIVQGILDENGLTAINAQSVVVISQNHVSELHLRSMGMKSLSRSVVKLFKLRVLDVGNNFLDSLPSTLGHMHDLEALIADSNSLWILPAQIGMIENLKKLDLSANMLQSLPEPMTYLRPSVLLDLDGNMLCNLGETTIKWADEYDPGWREEQYCR
jgi:hypothetical protein